MNYRKFLLPLLMLVLTACGGESSSESAEIGISSTRPLIVASNYPLYFFAREIAGDSAEVVFPEMEGDPANWKPGSEDIALLQSADLVILNGAGYESWLNWVSLPSGILLDTSVGMGDRLIPMEEEVVHQHGPQGEHSHQGVAFTTWLDATLAMVQASAIEQAISGLVPVNREVHQERLAGLKARLAELDEELQAAFRAISNQPLIFSHPVYQYLAARYGLNGTSVHWEPGEDPGVRAWIDFRQTLQRHPAKLMIWEDEPGEQITAQLTQLEMLTVTFHTASNTPADGDYFDVMKVNLENLSLP